MLVSLAMMVVFSGVSYANGPPEDNENQDNSGQEESAGWAPYNDNVRERPDADDYTYGSEEATAGSCTYRTRSDDIHFSTSQLSVHGWWEKVSPTGCPSRADVYVKLQGVWCDFGVGACWWKTIDTDKDRLRSGGGRGHRVTARGDCVSTAVTGFRSVVDVDLVGVSDPANRLKSSPVDFACRPWE